jgi:hypothetical protein
MERSTFLALRQGNCCAAKESCYGQAETSAADWKSLASAPGKDMTDIPNAGRTGSFLEKKEAQKAQLRQAMGKLRGISGPERWRFPCFINSTN